MPPSSPWQKLRGDPDEGCAHYYTGGWVSTSISRDAGSAFNFFYTPSGLPRPLWQAYTPTEEFEAIAQRLNDNDFTTLEERAGLIAHHLEAAGEPLARSPGNAPPAYPGRRRPRGFDLLAPDQRRWSLSGPRRHHAHGRPGRLWRR